MVEMVENNGRDITDHAYSAHSRRPQQCRICKCPAGQHTSSEASHASLWKTLRFPLVTDRMQGYSDRTLNVLKAIADIGGNPDSWDMGNRGWHKTAVNILIKDGILIRTNEGESPALYALSKTGTQACGWFGYTIAEHSDRETPAVEAVPVRHLYGRTEMRCGADGNASGTSDVSYATCQPCKDSMIIHAASGEVITDGMAVWDNNLDLGIVDLATLTSDGWFNVSTPDGERGSLMNGERVTTRHPFTGVLAADALNAAVEVSTVTTSTVESVAVLEGIQAAQDARMDDTERWFDQVVAISEQTIAAEGACLPDGCTAGYRHEPSYEFVISSHNNIDYATCQCGQFIQGNREAGYRLRVDVVTEREIARADKIAAGMPKVGDWLHNDTAGVTGRVVLISAHGRITLDTGDGHTRSAHWDVLSGEGFEHVPSSPAADRLMAEGEIESTVGPVYGGRRMEEITSYLLACGMDPADWDVEGLSDEIGRQSGPVSIDALPVDVWFALIRQFEMPAPVAPVAPVARVLSKPSATKVNRRKRKATRASRRRTGGRA